MKILKYLLYLVIVLAVIFFAFGLLMPKVEYGHEIIVDKPVKEAWAVSQDESKYADWLKGFKSMELLSGEKGAVGSKYKIIVNPGEGQPDFEMTETVISKEEFDHVEMHFDSEMMDFDQTIFFSEADGKTSIRSESSVSAKSFMTRSLFAIMETLGGAFQAQETENFEALKKLIEGNTTDYYPAPVVIESDTTITSIEQVAE